MKNLNTYKVFKKKVLFRADLNVPLVNGKITDYSRVNSIIPSIKKLTDNKNKVFIISHYGRPKGKVSKKHSLRFLNEELKKILKIPKIYFLETFDNELIRDKISQMKDGEVCLFENIRFNAGEELNNLNFAKSLSSNFDIFVNDAFSASHRNHASIVGISNFLPSLAGLSLIKEINNLDNFLKKVEKPNLAIIGGSKISTKIKVIYNLIDLFDTVVIAGAMANTFLFSNNINIGASLVEKDHIEIAKQIQNKAKLSNCKIILPIDVVCSKNLSDEDNIRNCKVDNIFNEHMVLDIGEQTSKLIYNEILKSRSVLWNGPLGAFEYKPFEKSSVFVANTINKYSKNLKIKTMAGGGDTIAVINLAKAKNGFDYLSNAGGAFLEWLEGNKSPGVLALEDNKT